jgi:miniconductance mechanosensitive channel
MTADQLYDLSEKAPFLVYLVVVILSYLTFRGTKFIIARLAYWVALRSKTIYDDLFVDRLQPFRFAWLAPLLLIYLYADQYLFEPESIQLLALILSIWFVTDLSISFLRGLNDAYRNHPRYTGVSVSGYTGLLQVLVVVAAIILTISYISDIDILTLLSGAGAWLAVLLLIFRDTILSFLANIQISTQKLIKTGDMVDVPAFGASGIIKGIDLQTITVQNFDNTATSIPTSKIIETGFKNYRIILESGTWRLKRAILFDVNSIKFVDGPLREKLANTEQINALLDENLLEQEIQTTNLQLFINYAQNYLKKNSAIRLTRYPFLIRALEHSPKGLPVEIYVFAKVPTWEKFEQLQAEIMIHLFATLPYFDLLTFQED